MWASHCVSETLANSCPKCCKLQVLAKKTTKKRNKLFRILHGNPHEPPSLLKHVVQHMSNAVLLSVSVSEETVELSLPQTACLAHCVRHTTSENSHSLSLPPQNLRYQNSSSPPSSASCPPLAPAGRPALLSSAQLP